MRHRVQWASVAPFLSIGRKLSRHDGAAPVQTYSNCGQTGKIGSYRSYFRSKYEYWPFSVESILKRYKSAVFPYRLTITLGVMQPVLRNTALGRSYLRNPKSIAQSCEQHQRAINGVTGPLPDSSKSQWKSAVVLRYNRWVPCLLIRGEASLPQSFKRSKFSSAMTSSLVEKFDE